MSEKPKLERCELQEGVSPEDVLQVVGAAVALGYRVRGDDGYVRLPVTFAHYLHQVASERVHGGAPVDHTALDASRAIRAMWKQGITLRDEQIVSRMQVIIIDAICRCLDRDDSLRTDGILVHDENHVLRSERDSLRRNSEQLALNIIALEQTVAELQRSLSAASEPPDEYPHG